MYIGRRSYKRLSSSTFPPPPPSSSELFFLMGSFRGRPLSPPCFLEAFFFNFEKREVLSLPLSSLSHLSSHFSSLKLQHPHQNRPSPPARARGPPPPARPRPTSLPRSPTSRPLSSRPRCPRRPRSRPRTSPPRSPTSLPLSSRPRCPRPRSRPSTVSFDSLALSLFLSAIVFFHRKVLCSCPLTCSLPLSPLSKKQTRNSFSGRRRRRRLRQGREGPQVRQLSPRSFEKKKTRSFQL